MKKIILPILVLLVAVAAKGADAPKAMESWLKSDAAGKVFPNLDNNARLDMVDYFNSNMTSPTVESYYDAKVSLILLEDRTLQLRSDDLTIDVTMLVAGKDTAVVVVETMPLGVGESTVRVYDSAGNLSERAHIQPVYSDWLVKDALRAVSEGALMAAMPYVTATAKVDASTGRLTYTNTSVTVPGIDESVVAVFRPTLKYDWKGGRYVSVR